MPLTVLYDGDCGFCRRCAAVLRRLDGDAGRLRLWPLQHARNVYADAPDLARLAESMHVRDAKGRWFVGARAWLRIARALPVLRPLAWLGGLPLVLDLAERVYSVIAANRHRISAAIGDGA